MSYEIASSEIASTHNESWDFQVVILKFLILWALILLALMLQAFKLRALISQTLILHALLSWTLILRAFIHFFLKRTLLKKPSRLGQKNKFSQKESVKVSLSLLYTQKFFGFYRHTRIAWSSKKTDTIHFFKIPSSF